MLYVFLTIFLTSISYNDYGVRKMEVYIEVTYLLNALLLFLSFEILSFLFNIHFTVKEMFKYMLTYNISFILIYIDVFEGFLIFYYLLLCLFYYRKQTYLYFPVFIFIYISLLSFFDVCLSEMIVFQCVLIVEGINISSLIIVIIILLVSTYFYIQYCSLKLSEKDDYVDVFYDNKQYLGFIDNGNQVYYKGYPLIFVNKKNIEEYHAIDSIVIKTALKKEKIEIIKIKEMVINHQILHNIYVGLIEECDYDFVLGPRIMGGVI